MRRWKQDEITQLEVQWPLSGTPPTVKNYLKALKVQEHQNI